MASVGLSEAYALSTELRRRLLQGARERPALPDFQRGPAAPRVAAPAATPLSGERAPQRGAEPSSCASRSRRPGPAWAAPARSPGAPHHHADLEGEFASWRGEEAVLLFAVSSSEATLFELYNNLPGCGLVMRPSGTTCGQAGRPRPCPHDEEARRTMWHGQVPSDADRVGLCATVC